MADANEKARRKEILRSQKAKQRQHRRDTLPCSPEIMSALFDYVDQHLMSTECDSTLRFTDEFIRDNHLATQQMIEWLSAAGAHCDCEVINNAEPLVDDAFHE